VFAQLLHGQSQLPGAAQLRDVRVTARDCMERLAIAAGLLYIAFALYCVIL
jgi:hypothetical protein